MSRQKGLERFVLLYRSDVTPPAWAVQDQSRGGINGDIIGRPAPTSQATQDARCPPMGIWRLWGSQFTLTNCKPRHMPLDFSALFPLQVPFATLHYYEENCIARLEVTMHNEPISDDTFEYVLSRFKGLIQNLAQRPEMILFIRSDARNSALPATRHIKRFLAFVQDNGSEFVLVGRGNAIVLRSRGFIGSSLAAIVRFVQRFFPSPWPETTVSTMEEAEEFLAGLAADAKAEFAAQAALELEQNEKSSVITQLQEAQENRSPTAAELAEAGVVHINSAERQRSEEEVQSSMCREDTVLSIPPTRWASPDVEAVPRSPAWLSKDLLRQQQEKEEAEEDNDATELQRTYLEEAEQEPPQVDHEDFTGETAKVYGQDNVTMETPAVTSWAGPWSPWLCGVTCAPCGWSGAPRHSPGVHSGVAAPGVQRALEPAQAASSRSSRTGMSIKAA